MAVKAFVVTFEITLVLSPIKFYTQYFFISSENFQLVDYIKASTEIKTK